MNNAWIVLGICVVILLGAALPLLRQGKQGLPPCPNDRSHEQANKP